MIDIKHILKDHAYQNIPLNFDEAYSLGLYALKGCDGDEMAQKQSIAALCALHTKATYSFVLTKHIQKLHKHRLPKSSAEQIAGVCAAIFEHDIKISENGYLKPEIEYAIGCCGMGGDLIETSNVSTLSSFIAASCGVYIAKHGSPGNTNRIGSSDFVSDYCNINTLATMHDAKKCLEQKHFCYTEALDTRYKRIHLQTHQIAKMPHMNDIIGPITNPVDPQIVKASVIGINHLVPPKVVAQAYMILNEKGITNLTHGLFVRGYADKSRYHGMDEVSICPGGTQVVELKDCTIREFDLYAEDFGLEAVSVESISPKSSKGEFSYKILKGEVFGPPLDMVLVNTALLLYLAGRSDNFKECYNIAKQAHESGNAYSKMLEIQNMIPFKTK